MFKKIKKAFKKITKKTIGGAAGLLGGSDKAPSAGAAPLPAPVQAQPQELAKPEEVVEETQDTTESAKKSARARGKRALSVARSGGTGVNI